MKQKGTVWAAFAACVFSGAFGGSLIAYIHNFKDPNWYLGMMIVYGLVALACVGFSRIEDDQTVIDRRLKEAQEKYAKETADIEHRRKALK